MKNLVNIYNKANKEGLNWYFEAHEFCKKLAEKHNIPLANVCGVVSALSPSSNWEQNKKDADRLLSGHTKGFVTYGQNVLKALKIKEAVNPLDYFSLKTGPKTYHFYLCLLNPNNTDSVVIDRHAFRIATGLEYKSITAKQYREISQCYCNAAKRLLILPSQLQAVLWVDYRAKEEIKFKEYQLENIPF